MRFAILLSVALAACSSPGIEYWRADPPRRVEAGGHRFDVYVAEDKVQVIRLDRTWLPRQAEVFPAAVAAIGSATGCAVREGSVKGDVAIVNARIDCPGATGG